MVFINLFVIIFILGGGPMIVEILAYDAGTLFGEHGHQIILKQVFQNHQIQYTPLYEEPYFINHPVDLIYLGGMSEQHLIKLNQRLIKHRQRIIDLIESGVMFLVFGNALDIFGKSIDFEDFGLIETLDIFNFTTVQKYRPRINNYIYGTGDGFEFTAHKSQFSQLYPDSSFQDFFFTVDKGFGMNRKSRHEGVHYKNFYGSSCVGPFLALNPKFMKHIFHQLDPSLSMPLGFETMEAAYQLRLEEFKSGRYSQISEILV